MDSQLLIEVSKEDVESLADALATIFVEEVSVEYVEIEEIDLDSLASSLAGIVDPFGQLKEWLEDLLESIASWIVSGIEAVIDTVKSALSDLINTAISGINAVASSLSGLWDYVTSWFMSVLDAISSLGSSIISSIDAVVSAVSNVASTVVESFNAVVSAITSAIDTVIKTVLDSLSALGETISGMLSAIIDAVSTLGSTVAEAISGAVSSIIEAISGVVDSIVSAIGGVVDFVKAGFETLASAISDIVAKITSAISDVASTIVESVSGFAKTLGEMISKGFESLASGLKTVGDLVSKLLTPEFWSEAFKPVVDFIVSNIVTPFIDTTSKILDNVVKGLDLITARLTGFINALTNLPTWFEEHLVKPLTDFLKPILEPLAESIKGITEPLATLGETLGNVFADPAKIIEGLKGVAKTAWNVVYSVGVTVANAVVGAFKTIVDFLKNAVKAVAKIGAKVGEAIFGALASAVKTITEPIVARASPAIFEDIAKPIIGIYFISFGLLDKLYEALVKLDLEELFKTPLAWMYKLFNAMIPALVITHFARRLLKAVAKTVPNPEVSLEPLGIGYKFKLRLRDLIDELTKMIDSAMPDVVRYMLIGHMIWWAEPTRALTRYWLTSGLTVELPPIQLTLETVRRRLLTGRIEDLYKFIENQLRMGGIYRGFIERIYGVDSEIIKLFKEKLKESADIFAPIPPAKYLPKGVVEKGMIVFKDRFMTDRHIPTSLMFTIPSGETLARWLVRDIFITPSHYEAVVTALGVFPDIARLQYMYSFMYPSPEKIWEFTMRGISGLLWFTPPEKIRKVFEQEAKWLNAGKPLAPVELNFKYKELFTALNWFMKWRQYANFSWFKKEIERYGIDFTADSWLVLDATADIPTKIDVRWMTKWAIFEAMSERGIAIKTPVKDFTKFLDNEAKSKEVTMDLTLMCRLLQATGLHPYYVPVVSVAEAINALADERTLLRTGFLNLYKEGFFTYPNLEKLLKEFVIASFKVAYFDMDKYDWEVKWINIPVRFLPAERRLLELRAVFDRALDVLRDYMRMLGRGVSYLIFKPDEAINMLKNYVHNVMNKWFTEEVKNITGRPLSLTLDEKWVKAYTEYFTQLRGMETVVRARYYSRYLIYHVIRRFERGFYTKEEATKLISTIVEKLKESSLFKELMLMVAEFTSSAYIRELLADAIISQVKRRKISKAEAVKKLTELGLSEELAKALVEAKATPYSISLTSLGTLLEVVPEALSYSVKSLALFGFNTEEHKYWLKYILRKPFKDELTLIRTRIYRAISEGISIEELVKTLKQYAIFFKIEDTKVKVEYGEVAKKLVEFYNRNKNVFEAYAISPEEWVMYNLIAELEAKEEGAREYIPTPSQLATVSEYVPEARKFTSEVLVKRRVPRRYWSMWMKYIDIKPLADEIDKLFSRVERLYTYFYVKPEDFEKVLESIRVFGFETREIEIMKWSADFERIYRAFDNVIGTPKELVTMAEYSPTARRFALGQVYKMIDALPVDQDTKTVLKAMWEEYIRIKPVSGEVSRYITELISDYANGVIDRATLESELNELKAWGLDDMEIEFLLKLAEKRKARYAIRRQMGIPYYGY